MAERTLIAKNVTREGPGLIEEMLQDHNFHYKVIDLTRADTIPNPDSFDILIVLGGPDSANDTTVKMQSELTKIRKTIDAGKPYLGICLGMQTLVKAIGGTVVKSPVKEIGFRNQSGEFNTVDLTSDGKVDPLFEGLGERFKVFHMHGETVELSDDMQLLASGEDVQNQIVKVGSNAYGIQCHFELTPEMLKIWLKQDPDLQKANQNQIREDFENLEAEYTKVGKQLINNFLNIAQ